MLEALGRLALGRYGRIRGYRFSIFSGGVPVSGTMRDHGLWRPIPYFIPTPLPYSSMFWGRNPRFPFSGRELGLFFPLARPTHLRFRAVPREPYLIVKEPDRKRPGHKPQNKDVEFKCKFILSLMISRGYGANQ